MLSIPELLHQTIDECGFNQAELCERAGIPTSTLNHYFRRGNGFKGSRLPEHKYWSGPVKKALVELGVPTERIVMLFGSGPPSHDMEEMKAQIDALNSLVVRLQSRLDVLESTEKPQRKIRKIA